MGPSLVAASLFSILMRRGSAVHRGDIAIAQPIHLGTSSPSKWPTFSVCNFCFGFFTAVLLIIWILSPFDE